MSSLPNEVIHNMAEDPTLSDNPEGEDRPEWLPENFKSPEDLATSYKESQRKITEEATARRNLEQLVAQQQATLEQLTAAQQQPAEDDSQQWYDAYEADPIATQKALAERAAADAVAKLQQQSQQQYAPIQASQVEVVAGLAFQQLERNRGELTPEFRQAMSDIVAEKPYLIPDDAYQSPAKLADSLDVVYSLATQKVAPAGPSQADLMRTMKLNAQTSEGAAGRPSPADDFENRWKEIQNAQTRKFSDL